MPDVNGPILSALVIFTGAVLAGVRRAFLTPEHLREKFRDDRGRTKAAIEADHVIPAIAALVGEVAHAVGTESIQDVERIQASLQSVDYLPRLNDLSERYKDYSDCDRLIQDAQKWARRRGFSLLIFLLGTVALGAQWSFKFTLPFWAIASTATLLVIGATIAVVAWWQEMTDRNRMVGIFNRYE